MKALRDALDRVHPWFVKGAPLEKAYPVYEALDTFLYTPGETTRGLTHVRDAIDLKRMMITVVLALVPVTLFGMWNTGHQANTAIQAMAEAGETYNLDWHSIIFTTIGFEHNAADHVGNFVYGAIYFLPIYIVCMFVGGHIELVFSVLRGHEINEGFLVTGSLFPLVLPPTIPLWQVAVGIVFGVLIGKEIFGGTGMNILNPALVARAFLFFAYPAQISGDKVWIAADTMVDGLSGATWLGKAALTAGVLSEASWLDAFVGIVPGSMGETSALACLMGAGILIATRVGAWQTMVGVVAGTIGLTLILNGFGSDTNPMFAMPFWWHMVLGGWAFGAVFMATDPVSSAFTHQGKLAYGFGIGALVVLVRVINPAYPEGMMLAILFMNLFAPFLDHFVVQANIKRRLARNVAA